MVNKFELTLVVMLSQHLHEKTCPLLKIGRKRKEEIGVANPALRLQGRHTSFFHCCCRKRYKNKAAQTLGPVESCQQIIQVNL